MKSLKLFSISKVLACLVLFSTNISHADETNFGLPTLLTTTDGNPSGVVAGCVSAIDGVYFDSETDLVIPGPLPIVCHRTYNSHSNRWDFYPGSFINNSNKTTDNHCPGIYYRPREEIYSFDGTYLVYSTKAHYNTITTSISEHITNGYTNTGKGYIGGKTNLLNQNYDPQAGILKGGGGVTATYVNAKDLENLALISRVDFPNKNFYTFDYGADKNIKVFDHFARFIVTACGRNGKLYGQAWLDHGNYLSKKSDSIHLYSLKDGRSVSYKLDLKIRSLLRPIIHKATGQHIPTVEYQYTKGKLTKKTYPETGRFVEIQYDKYGRVCELMAPIGKDGASKSVSSLRYFNHYTQVTDSLRNSTIYSYDKYNRLECVEKIDSQKKTLFLERYISNLLQESVFGKEKVLAVQRS